MSRLNNRPEDERQIQEDGNGISRKKFQTKSSESEERASGEVLRALAMEDVRSSAQKLQSQFLGQMETRLTTMMDDIVDSLQKTELPQKFMMSDPVLMKDKRKASVAGRLPEKVFRSRPSLLTELLEVPHFQTIHHIFIAALALIMLHTMILDLLTGTLDLGLERLMWAFGPPQNILRIILPLEFCTLAVLYPAFNFWATQRRSYKADTKRVIDRVAAALFFLFMMGFICIPASFMWKNPLQPAGGCACSMEQCRLLMKMYAFVRSNVPRALKFAQGSSSSTGVNIGTEESKEIDYHARTDKSKTSLDSSSGSAPPQTRTSADTNASLTSLRRRETHDERDSEYTHTTISGEAQKENENGRNGKKTRKTRLDSKRTLWDSPCPEFSKYLYFFFAPTLIYQDSYPRTSKVRWDYVCWNFAQVFGCIIYGSFILGRCLKFYFGNFGHPSHPMTVAQLVDALFSLMLPGILGLVLGFFLLLHAWQNAWSEMLCFADRLFYKDWWNQGSFASYYKTWNVLVHDWLYTYIFKDAWDSGLGKKFTALPTILVFSISSLFHEYILSLSFNFCFPVLLTLFGGFGFALVFIKSGNGAFGNVLMWMSLIAGCGIIVSAYTMEYFARINCPSIDWSNELYSSVWRVWTSHHNETVFSNPK